MLIINNHHYSTITSMLITCSAHNQNSKKYINTRLPVIFLSVDRFLRGNLIVNWSFTFYGNNRHNCSHIEVGELLIELMSDFSSINYITTKSIKLHLIKSIRVCKMYDDLLNFTHVFLKIITESGRRQH